MSKARCRTRPRWPACPSAWPCSCLRPADFEEIFAHAMWLKTWFQDRAAIALELLHRAGDDELVERVVRVAGLAALPIVAAGDVLMHVRSRKPLQDTLTATRLGLAGRRMRPRPRSPTPSSTCARAAGWRRCTRPSGCTTPLRLAGQCSFSLGELRYEYPQEIVPAGETPASHLRKLTYAGAERRFGGGQGKTSIPATASTTTPLLEKYRPQIESELEVIATLKYEAYFLTVADIVRWAREQKHPLPGPRQRRQLDRLLLPRRHRGRSGARDAAVRALHQRRAQRAARHRHRLRAPAPRGGHPVHLRQVRPAPRGAHRGGHQLPAALGAARRRPSPGHRPAAHRCGLEEPALVRRPRHRPRAAARERLRPRVADREAVDRAHRAADRLSRATSRSTPAASSSPAAAWPSWCRSRTRR